MAAITPLHLAFGQALKEWRQQRGFSQEQLAELVEVSTSFIGMLERGEKNTTLEVIGRICDALSIEVKDLFQASEESPPSHRRLFMTIGELLRTANDEDVNFICGVCELFMGRISLRS